MTVCEHETRRPDEVTVLLSIHHVFPGRGSCVTVPLLPCVITPEISSRSLVGFQPAAFSTLHKTILEPCRNLAWLHHVPQVSTCPTPRLS